MSTMKTLFFCGFVCLGGLQASEVRLVEAASIAWSIDVMEALKDVGREAGRELGMSEVVLSRLGTSSIDVLDDASSCCFECKLSGIDKWHAVYRGVNAFLRVQASPAALHRASLDKVAEAKEELNSCVVEMLAILSRLNGFKLERLCSHLHEKGIAANMQLTLCDLPVIVNFLILFRGGNQKGKSQARLIRNKWVAFQAWRDSLDVDTLSDVDWRMVVTSHKDLLLVYKLLPECAKNLALGDLERLFLLLRCANLLQRYKALLECIGDRTRASLGATPTCSNSDVPTEPYPAEEDLEREAIVREDELV